MAFVTLTNTYPLTTLPYPFNRGFLELREVGDFVYSGTTYTKTVFFTISYRALWWYTQGCGLTAGANYSFSLVAGGFGGGTDRFLFRPILSFEWSRSVYRQLPGGSVELNTGIHTNHNYPNLSVNLFSNNVPFAIQNLQFPRPSSWF